MAIVKTIHCANGGTVLIDDDCYAGISQEEKERRRAEISRAILSIDRAVQLRRAEERKGSGAQAAPAE